MKDLFQCSDFGSTRIVHVTLPAVSCCILSYPVVSCCRYDFIAFGFGHDKLGSALRLFGSSALRLNSSWKDGALDVAGAFGAFLLSFS